MFVIEIILLSLGCIVLFLVVWSTVALGISPMPTLGMVKQELLKLIPEELEGEVYELGVGWGTLAWAVASRCPRCSVVGWEASPIPYLFCRIRMLFQPRFNLTLRFGNFHHVDLRNAKLVLTYLWTGAMMRLGPKFDAELSPGATVISHTFAWRGKTPEVTRIVSDLYRTKIYQYRIAEKSGWKEI